MPTIEAAGAAGGECFAKKANDFFHTALCLCELLWVRKKAVQGFAACWVAVLV
jgi:hypothetical protein